MKHMLVFFMAFSLLLASAPTTHAGPGRPSFSSRPSSGGFRSSSSPSYRSFSSSPSRMFTFRSTPRYTAPRSYSVPQASTPAPSRSTYRSAKKTVINNNHYHGSGTASGGGGLSLMDYVILDNLTSRDRGPAYVSATAPSPGSVVVQEAGSQPGAVVYREESHFWSGFFLLLAGIGLLYGVYRLFRYLAG